MGQAFAHRFAAEGMKIVAADIQQDALTATVDRLAAVGHDVTGVPTDVADPESVGALADAAIARFGAVHLLCNNAGVEGYLDGAIWEATDRDWTWTVNVNFWSVVHGIRAFVPRMLAHGEPGHIVNTCSMTAVVSAANMYGITKHAVLALSEVLAADLRRPTCSAAAGTGPPACATRSRPTASGRAGSCASGCTPRWPRACRRTRSRTCWRRPSAAMPGTCSRTTTGTSRSGSATRRSSPGRRDE